MAAHRTSNRRHKSDSRNQGSQSMRRPEPEQEASSSAYGAVGEIAEQASDYVREEVSEAQECIREHSGAAIAFSLVAGFGVGLLIGRALGMPHHESRSRRYRAAAEGMGRRLMDRIESIIPEALAEHFGK